MWVEAKIKFGQGHNTQGILLASNLSLEVLVDSGYKRHLT